MSKIDEIIEEQRKADKIGYWVAKTLMGFLFLFLISLVITSVWG